jgi:pre-peptidase
MSKPSDRRRSSYHQTDEHPGSPPQVIRSSGRVPTQWVSVIIRSAALALGLLAAVFAPAYAGGPYDVSNSGEPMRWDQSAPVHFALDRGDFGPRTHAWAAATADRALHLWQETPGAHLQIEMAKELSRDINGDNVSDFLDGLTPASASPIMLDGDGTILDTLLGDGASSVVLGIGLPYVVDEQRGRLQVCVAILNGLMQGEFTDSFSLGNFIHELGHCFNLAHSQLNADLLYDGDPDNDADCPSMFYRGPNDKGGLSADDRAWFAWLYPSAESAGLGSISGHVRLPDGVTGLRGIQVFARRTDDPRGVAVGTVSGFLFGTDGHGSPDPNRLGEFIIPGLPPGAYTVELRQLDPYPGVPVRAGYLFSGSKFYREGSTAQDPPTASTPIVVNAGQAVTGIDILVNGESLGEPKAVAEQEPNELPGGQSVTLPAFLSGKIEDRAATGEGDSHDVYRFTLREPTTVTAVLTADQGNADLDLDLLYLDNQSYFVLAESTEKGTPPESMQFRLPPGRYYFGVHRVGDRGSAYTLRLSATPSPDAEDANDAVWINYLVVGDVTTTGASVRWQATGDTTAVVYYNKPRREIGSTTRASEHALALTDLPKETRSDVEVYASSPGGVDVTYAPFKTAVAPEADGVPRIVVGTDSYPVDYDLWEVEVRLSNPGDGDAQKVQIESITPAAGWAVLSTLYTGTKMPDAIDVGGIGAGGAGALIIRLIRLRGEEDPDVKVHGTYIEASGRVRKF